MLAGIAGYRSSPLYLIVIPILGMVLMISTLALITALWPSPVLENCRIQADTDIVGIAYNENGKFSYCEIVSRSSDKKLHINYYASNTVFAYKDVDYASTPYTPNIRQLDTRFGEVLESSIITEQAILTYTPDSNKKTRQTTVPLKSIDVIDAGFDEFIRANWSELLAGKTLSINFASIVHQKIIPLRIVPQTEDNCLDKSEVPIQSQLCFFVEIDNAFLRMLFGNIKLSYDHQRRLQKFNGVVNILDTKEKNQTATIYYYYREDYKVRTISD